MKLPVSSRRALHGERSRRGAVLMLAMLVLFVLLLIVFQISISTGTNARVVRNEQTIRAMDLAIESSFLEVNETHLIADAADAAAEEEMGGLGDAMGGGGGGDAGGASPFGGGEEGGGNVDGKNDSWAQPISAELNEVRLRIVIQDEDSKFNLLSILTPDEDEAEAAFERLVRVIEYSRKGTRDEIDGSTARTMAQRIRDYMTTRQDQHLPQTPMLSDNEEERDMGLMLSLRELVAVDPDVFNATHFRDYVNEDEEVVHSLGSFLTVWTSLGTAEGGGAPGGGDAPSGAPTPPAGGGGDDGGEGGEDAPAEDDATTPGIDEASLGTSETEGEMVNLNTAPLAVLKALHDDRELPYDFWDQVLIYRNEIDEEAEEAEDGEEMFDELGEEIEKKLKEFGSLDDLSEIDAWEDVDVDMQADVTRLLKTTSDVFSIFVTARKATGRQQSDWAPDSREAMEEERKSGGIVRTVRSVVWRRSTPDGEVEIIPLVRWEVLDYIPIEVRDFPEDEEERLRR